MKNLKDNKSLLALVLISIILFGIVFIFVFFLNPVNGLFGDPDIEVDIETLKQDYSNLNQLNPGSSSIDDVIAINGEPSSTNQLNGKTYMYYPTPFEKDGNIVLINGQGKVEYVFEYVFDDYRGAYKDFTTKYGTPSFRALSNISEHDSWSVFLEDGVMVMNSGDKIDAISYFIPQDKTTFMNSSLANDFELQEYNEDSGSVGGELFFGPDSTPEPE